MLLRHVEERFTFALKERCLIHNDLLKGIIHYKQNDPSTTAKLLLRRDNLVATKVGGVLLVAPCKEINPEMIDWDHQVDNVYYENLPFRVLDRPLFASPFTRILKAHLFRKDYQQRRRSVYKEAAIWTNGRHQVPVQEIHNNMELQLYKDHIEFMAQAYYDPKVEKVKKN